MSFLLGIYSKVLLPLVDQIILCVIRAKKIVIDGGVIGSFRLLI